jgi:hypothetical protein
MATASPVRTPTDFSQLACSAWPSGQARIVPTWASSHVRGGELSFLCTLHKFAGNNVLLSSFNDT